jgi:peptide/nickel transport system substrate-binding protein
MVAGPDIDGRRAGAKEEPEMEAGYWERLANRRAIGRRKMLGLMGSGLTGAALLAACGGDDADDSSTGSDEDGSAQGQPRFTPSEGTAQPGGRMRELQTRTTASFHVYSDLAEGWYLSGKHVYDRLLTAREDERRYRLEAAETVETPDPLTVRFKLKPSVYHDIAPVNGRAVTAADVVACMNFVRDLPRAFNKTFHTQVMESVEAPDNSTVVFHLKKPAAYLFGQALLGDGNGHSIVPPETFDNLTTARPIGSGPFTIDVQQLNVDYVYKKNPKFREASKGIPHVDEWEMKIITDPIAAEAAFRADQLDKIHTSSTTADGLVRDMGSRVRHFRQPGLYVGGFHMNMTKGLPWEDERVREAFWRLTNRQQVVDLALAGYGELPPGLLPVSLTAYQVEAEETDSYQQEDVAKARQLLTAANYDPSRRTNFLVGAGGASEVAQVLQQQFRRGGVETDIDTAQGGLAQLFQRWLANDFEVFFTSSPNGTDPGNTVRLQHSLSWTPSFKGFALMDPALDALIERSEQALDQAENERLVKEIQLTCIKRFTPVRNLYNALDNDVLHLRVQNWELVRAEPIIQTDAWLKQS